MILGIYHDIVKITHNSRYREVQIIASVTDVLMDIITYLLTLAIEVRHHVTHVGNITCRYALIQTVHLQVETVLVIDHDPYCMSSL